MEEGHEARIKATEFIQESQEARCGNPGSWADGDRQLVFDLTDQGVGGLVR